MMTSKMNNSARLNEDNEVCPICLNKISSRQIVAVPDCCEHTYCPVCLKKWAEEETSCPLDREVFNKIIIKRNKGEILQTIVIRESDRTTRRTVIRCCICAEWIGAINMVYCVRCHSACHLQCVYPPMAEVPPEGWYCATCITELRFSPEY